MTLHTQNQPFHAGFEIITDNGDAACFIERDCLAGFEIITDNGDSAYFVEHNDLAGFEQSTGVSEEALVWAAALGEMVHFDARDWTVGFLLPYAPNTDTAECECWEEDMAGDLMVAC
ncbi:hypothetical protein AB9F29_21280 [Falsihalocynthiibacter sp. S25ZX9]|uniref:hypothetical protein n=1 Tax=Falsihalocynthiibacter sp. S25ZX9 TaxID=3240870 RepID=UPI0035106B12